MPIWLSILISLAIKFGVPWILNHFPFLSADVKAVIERLVQDLASHAQEKKEIVADAKAELKAVCSGVACPPTVKGD